MDNIHKVRTRFAPSPSGAIHLGNLRAAIFCYVFAKKFNGKFILRIEDTDLERTDESEIDKISKILKICDLKVDEGPYHGPFAPYRQSQRNHFYLEALAQLQQNGNIYKCFCTKDELELDRQLQLKTGKPPKYSRKCMGMSHEVALKKTEFGLPFVWRFRLNLEQKFHLNDLCKGQIAFDLANFSDFTITRPDGTFTFMFCNFVDDWKMEISHVIRGEDHISNTALQLALYDAFMVKPPVFGHLPMILGQDGSKLSKRDKHFSIENTLNEGFLPQALCDYLLRIGHWSDATPRSLTQIVQEFDPRMMHAASTVRYDEGQLVWLNEQWLKSLSAEQLSATAAKTLPTQWAEAAQIPNIYTMLESLKTETKNLKDLLDLCIKLANSQPAWLTKNGAQPTEELQHLLAAAQTLQQQLAGKSGEHLSATELKTIAQEHQIPLKNLYQLVRFTCTGTTHGLAIDKILQLTATASLHQKLNAFSQMLQ